MKCKHTLGKQTVFVTQIKWENPMHFGDDNAVLSSLSSTWSDKVDFTDFKTILGNVYLKSCRNDYFPGSVSESIIGMRFK